VGDQVTIKYILAALILGGTAGYVNNNLLNVVPNALISEQIFTFVLVAILFVFGFSFALDRNAVNKIRKSGLRIVAFPLLVALGSLIGGLFAGLLLQISFGGAMAVSSGYGWYTLSGPMMGQLLGPEWGTLGFTANFFRELITITTIPLMVKLDRYAPVASGGGTTMDTTLGLIVRYCGKDTVIVAFSNGFILSLIAPFATVALASLA
jgi:uncharacterized membrane protein YbjE (DUF340 family)